MDIEKVEGLRQIFDERLFRSTITRERRRTERSGLAMAVLLIGLHGDRQEDAAELFVGVADALSAIKSDVDIAGWFEHHSILGLVVPDINTGNLTEVCDRLEEKLRREISRRFNGGGVDRLSIRLLVYPEPRRLGEEDAVVGEHADELEAGKRCRRNAELGGAGARRTGGTSRTCGPATRLGPWLNSVGQEPERPRHDRRSKARASFNAAPRFASCGRWMPTGSWPRPPPRTPRRNRGSRAARGNAGRRRPGPCRPAAGS